MKVKRKSEVAQPCLTLSDPMDCSLPDSIVHGIFQERVLEWGPLPSLVAMLIPDKTGFRTRNIFRDKKGNYIIIRKHYIVIMSKKDIILNAYKCNREHQDK